MVVNFRTAEYGPVPARFIPLTLQKYVVLFARPETALEVLLSESRSTAVEPNKLSVEI